MDATAHAEIQVYASFPHEVALGADLNLDANNWRWVHCLTFPIETLEVLQFSPRPYKWIRYAIGIVVGAQGDLSSSADLLNIVDYNASFSAESAALYYHYTSDDERRRIFPVDPKIARTTTTSSVATSRRVNFRSDAADRDGSRCVLTGIFHVVCDAVHLLAHSKGDAYISTFAEHRSRDPARGDLIQEIDSVRNGIFLNKLTHAVLGTHVAFLPTPNFAMDTSDLDPRAPPGEERCTAHLFDPNYPECLVMRPSGSPIRISNSPNWPPAILFDGVYAGAVLHHFGTQALKTVLTETWMDTFYPNGVLDQAQAELKKQKQVQECQAHYERRAVPDTFDMLMMLPYVLTEPNKLRATLREAKEKAAAEEQKHIQEKVDTWQRQVSLS
ncbi:hypothetical protein GALMADRAFT_446224 [Galerina marginata CBS 339.88]|uniref:HNH nuclease domain-containing protein n=1 Tax=Galerina marginata (strain CBS 339.88) TaxID=685588 RepID=A0A067T2E1_GALM3|nr:hypothetical protein GALMADRAFT_446224 [Galerina marginata CBS 339.88]